MCSSKINWIVTENNVKERMIDDSLIHTFLPSQTLRKKTKVCNALLRKYCGVKNYKQYVELKTSVLRNVEENTETDIDTGLTDADCSFIHSSPSKRAQYVAENIEKYTFEDFTSEDESTGNKTRKKRKTKTSTRAKTTRAKIQKKKRATGEKKVIPKAQNKKQVPCDTTKASKASCALGWQDVANHNRDISYLSDNFGCIDISYNEEDSFNSTSEHVNSSDPSVTMDKATPQDVTYNNKMPVDTNTTQRCKTDYTSSIEIDENHYQEDIEIDDSIEVKINCDQLLSYITSYQHSTSVVETSCVPLDTMLLDQQNMSVHEDPQLEFGGFSNFPMRNPSPLDIVQEMLSCPEEFKKIAEAINLDDIKEEGTCYGNIANQVNGDAQESPREEKKNNFPRLDQADEDVKVGSMNQEETAHFTPEINSCDIKEQILLSPEQSPVKSKHSELCRNLNNIFEELGKVETIDFSEQEMKNPPSNSNQVDRNVDADPTTRDEAQLIKVEESPHKGSFTKVEHSELYSVSLEEEDNKNERKSSAVEEETRNSATENRNDIASVSANHKDTIHSIQVTENMMTDCDDLCDIQKQEILSSTEQSPEKDTQSKVDDISQNEDDDQVQELSRQEDSGNFDTKDEDTELDAINEEDKILRTKTDGLSDAGQTVEQSPVKDVLSPRQSPRKDAYSCNNTLEEQDIEEMKKLFEKENEDLMNCSVNNEDKTPVARSEVICDNTAKEQLLPRVTCTEIINKKYKIIEKRAADICSNVDKVDSVNGVINGYTPIKNNILINSTNVSDCNVDEDVALEADYEEDSENCVSPRTKKRREQARLLNLVIYSSDSSESDGKTERGPDFSNSDTKHRGTNIVRVVSENKQTKCTEIETSQLRVSESNAFCNSDGRMKKSCANKRSSLNKENVCDKSNHCRNGTNIGAAETRKSKREENIEISTNRPRNLRELVEDQNLVVETIAPTLTLADISDDEEAYILNVPTKLLECNLKNQLLILKENTITFGKSKYRIVDKQVNTISWVFATGKKRKPYRIVNLNNVSTVTILDNVSHYSKTLDSRGIVRASCKTDVNKQHRKKVDSKLLNYKNRKRNNSDLTVEQPAVKKGCN